MRLFEAQVGEHERRQNREIQLGEVRQRDADHDVEIGEVLEETQVEENHELLEESETPRDAAVDVVFFMLLHAQLMQILTLQLVACAFQCLFVHQVDVCLEFVLCFIENLRKIVVKKGVAMRENF